MKSDNLHPQRLSRLTQIVSSLGLVLACNCRVWCWSPDTSAVVLFVEVPHFSGDHVDSDEAGRVMPNDITQSSQKLQVPCVDLRETVNYSPHPEIGRLLYI